MRQRIKSCAKAVNRSYILTVMPWCCCVVMSVNIGCGHHKMKHKNVLICSSGSSLSLHHPLSP